MGYALDKNRGSRRRMKLALIIFALIFVSGVSSVFQQMSKIDQKEMELMSLQKQLDAYKTTHLTYQQELRRLNDPEYIMQRDRKMFHMTKENEIPFILQGDDE